MATATAALMSAEEFAEFCRRPENVGRRLELDHGEVVEMGSPGEAHGMVCWFVIALLTDYVRARRAGYILTNDAGLIVGRRPDTVRGPDVMAFLGTRRLDQANAGAVDRTPSLVVEVFSPHDRPGRLQRRLNQYLASGVPMVWVLFPEERTVDVYRRGAETAALEEGDILEGGAELPGFRCEVSDLFRFADTDAPDQEL